MPLSPKKEFSKNKQKELRKIAMQYAKEGKELYSKKQFVSVYKGYDFLENLFIIRTYVQKKYDISWGDLELLLKLMGMKIFNAVELRAIPRGYNYNKMNNLLDTGFVDLVQNHIKADSRIFTISVKGRNIVIDFYRYLSGEKKIPLDYTNPMVNKKSSVPYDVRKVEVLKKLNELPMKDYCKTFLGDD